MRDGSLHVPMSEATGAPCGALEEVVAVLLETSVGTSTLRLCSNPHAEARAANPTNAQRFRKLCMSGRYTSVGTLTGAFDRSSGNSVENVNRADWNGSDCTSGATGLRTTEIPAVDSISLGTRIMLERARILNVVGEKVLVLLNANEVGRRDADALLGHERGDVRLPVPGARRRYMPRDQSIR